MIVIDIVSLALRACYTYALPFSTHLDAPFLLFLAIPTGPYAHATRHPLYVREPAINESFGCMTSDYVNATLV